MQIQLYEIIDCGRTDSDFAGTDEKKFDNADLKSGWVYPRDKWKSYKNYNRCRNSANHKPTRLRYASTPYLSVNYSPSSLSNRRKNLTNHVTQLVPVPHDWHLCSQVDLTK